MSRRVMLQIVAVLLLAATGCGGPDHKAAIRVKFEQLTGHVCRDEVDACVPLVDPVYVRGQGEAKVKGQLKILAGVFKLGKITPADVRIEDIVVAKDARSAEVLFSLQSRGEWKSQKPSKWVLADGQWYFGF